VTIIGAGAFQNKGITSVVIPDSVITIENGRAIAIGRNSGAFSHNPELTTINLGRGPLIRGQVYSYMPCYRTPACP
jgi:hypothetical protein